MSLAGACAFVPGEPPEHDPPPASVEPDTHPAPAAPTAATSPPARPAEMSRPPPPRAPERVLVLLPPQSDAFGNVLAELDAQLAARQLATTHATLDALAAGDGALGDDAPSLVIAVGSAATRAALDRVAARVVFCQVPDLGFEAAPRAYGVASLPPLDLQLKAWRRLDPTLRRIGLVLGRDEALLAARAQNAAEALGLELELRLASSDQEAVYHFRRLAAQVDGLWLLPDNAVLSPRAIRQMLEHAAEHRVQTLVFTPSLLEWGALLSVAATELDLARTLAEVTDVLAKGRAHQLPPITPLSELEVRVNVPAAQRLGLETPRQSWIERSGTP